MSRELIVDYMPFRPIGSLNESSGDKYGIPGGFVVQGILQRSGAKNQNGRIYPKNILMRECSRYQLEYIDQHRALGELDHPDDLKINFLVPDEFRRQINDFGLEKIITELKNL